MTMLSKEFAKLKEQYRSINSEIQSCRIEGDVTSLRLQQTNIIKEMKRYLVNRNNNEVKIILLKHLDKEPPVYTDIMVSNDINLLSEIDSTIEYHISQQRRDDLNDGIRNEQLKRNKYSPNNPYDVDSL